MNLVDAVCKVCQQPIRWLSGSTRMCIPCWDKLVKAAPAK